MASNAFYPPFTVMNHNATDTPIRIVSSLQPLPSMLTDLVLVIQQCQLNVQVVQAVNTLHIEHACHSSLHEG